MSILSLLAQFDLLNPEIFKDLAFSKTAGDWLFLGVNLILSTLIGGIVLIVLVGILSRTWGEPVNLANSFLIVLIINIVIMVTGGFLAGYSTLLVYVLTLFIWIILVKVFFSSMRFLHALIVGIVGYIFSIFLVPVLVGMIIGFIPMGLS